ncbi:hypothetical protein RB595_008103 [Gaeumannomyces hyphopodioides]
MRATTLFGALALPTLGLGIRVIQGNDDGWAEMYVRTMHDALMEGGHDAVLSSPAEQKSGTGSHDRAPEARATPCQYDSCPANSGPVGSDPNDPRLNWVNSFPVTAIKYGLDTFGPQIWGNNKTAELAVCGPNVGGNRWLQLPFSGTVGASVEAVKQGIPAIAFSGASGTSPQKFNHTDPSPRAKLYSELAMVLINKVVSTGKPYLPAQTFLNVNFPDISDKCKSVGDFKWIMTRVMSGLFSGNDAPTCGRNKMPAEFELMFNKDCFISVSVGDANDKTTAAPDKQQVVLDKLGDFLSCLP